MSCRSGSVPHTAVTAEMPRGRGELGRRVQQAARQSLLVFGHAVRRRDGRRTRGRKAVPAEIRVRNIAAYVSQADRQERRP